MKTEITGNNTMREHKTNGVYTDTASSGVSSNDTHRSSVRYEPVVTDHSCTPPSPGRHGSRHKLLNNGKRRSPRMTDDDITDDERHDDNRDEEIGDDDDIASMDDVVRSEELRPLNSRRRMSSPVIEQHVRDQYGGRRESSFLARTNSGTVYVTKGGPTTLPNDPRHQTGLPRMGTGLPLTGNTAVAQNTVPIGPTPSLYKPQVPTSLVTSRLTTSQTEQFDPVVTLKPAHEDQSGWNYMGGSDVRTQYPFSGGPSMPPHRQHSATTPSGDDTAARFMSKRPSLANAYNATRHMSNTQFESSTFKCFKSKFSSGCSWKCTAWIFITITVLLLALVGYFVVQSFTASDPVESAKSECRVDGQGSGVTVINGNSGSNGPSEIQLGRRIRFSVPPGTFWRSLVFMGEESHLKFNFTVNRRAVLGIYGRRGIEPTHTKYDFFEPLDGASVPVTSSDMTNGRRKRDVIGSSDVTLSFVQFLDTGSWYLGVYNDGEKTEEVEVYIKLADDMSSCPNNCNGNGDCVDGVCKCFPRFQGMDCAEASCPVVCSGRGLYAHGVCVCFSGWKGKDCSIPTDQCEVTDCSGRGVCGSDGECECNPGWTGAGCEIVTCLSPTCSDHGVCVSGLCHCDRGWKGQNCDDEDSGCFDKCSGQGTYNDVTKACVCDAGWIGRDCSQVSAVSLAPCLPSCHPDHGTCLSGVCQCNEGWTGQSCDQRTCHARCQKHGTCSNGECVCDVGWNGDTCTLDGCPDNCGDHGHCTKGAAGYWSCSCNQGWKGIKCEVAVELVCGDGRDNDGDTLADCHDPDCCSNSMCRQSSECRGSADPALVLASSLGRTKQTPTLPFYERVRFLTKPSSGIQTVSSPAIFEPSDISVLRGRVVTLDGSPLVGVRVRVKDRSEFGSTKTRSDGWFDFSVNGGGSVTLQFDRPLLLPATVTSFVPLNEFVLIPEVTMRTASQPDQLVSDVTFDGNCDVSVFPRPRVIILPSNVQAFTADNCDDRGSVIPETQAMRETINLPFSGVDLVYLSSRTTGYKSKIDIQLSPPEVASNLKRIYLKISLQGILYDKIFEPFADMRYSFVWERDDAYGQPVYGTVTAKVEVGYEYEMCPSIVWDSSLTSIEGHDPIMAHSIGGWSINIHHTYHTGKGVVHLGNGGTMRLDRQPPMMSTVMGNGEQRHLSCDKCTGPAKDMELLAPVALACDASGNIFVGDFHYIRKISSNGHVSSLLYWQRPPHKYYMATSPTLDGFLYFSDPVGKRVYRVRNMNPQSRGNRKVLSAADLSSNMEVVAGSGATCLPLVKGNCGDDGPALAAKLSGPRGLVVDMEGRVYFIDGAKIRVVERSGTIRTFAGSYSIGASRPLPCEGTISLSQLQLDFPTSMSINPHDGSLFVLDTDIVVKIDITNRQASLVAGVPVHCSRKAAMYFDDRDSRRVPLVSPVAITLSPRDGSLYITESDNEFVHRVRRIDTYRLRITTIAGADTSCDCQLSECDCFKGDGDFARSARLNTPAALAAAPNGSVYIADQLNLRIREISTTLPESNLRGKFRIANPDSNHVYVFSSDGLHLTTQNVITGTTVYNFTYTPDGLLNSITDVHGNRLSIIHDNNEVPYKILLPNQKVLQLQFNEQNALQKVIEDYSPLASFTYHGDGSSLLQSVTKGLSASSFFVYDVHGRLISAVTPTGSMTTLHAQLNATSHTVTMATAATSVGSADDNERGVGARAVVITTQPGHICDVVTTKEGEMTATYKRWTDNSISVHFLDGSELSLETKPHPVLGLTAPFLAKRTIHLPNDPLENNIEWRTRKQLESPTSKDERYLLGRRMRVNGRNILSLDYSQNQKMEKIYDDHTKFVLRIKYNDRGMPTLWMPSNGITPVNVTYDRPGHPATWQRGPNHETMRYDEKGQVTSRKTADGAVWSYVNKDNVVRVTIPGTSSRYTFVYDDFENVRRVTLPSGGVFTVNRFMGIGFRRIQIENQAATMRRTIDYDDKNNILMQANQGEGRKVVYRYDTHGHMTEVLHDMQSVRMLRDPRSGEMVSITTDDCVTRFYRNGPLVQRLTVTSQSPEVNKDLSAIFEYTHDVNLRLKSLKASVSDTNLPMEVIRYDDVSGKITLFGSYSVLYYQPNMYVISTSDVTFTKEHDHNGRPVQVDLGIYRTPVFILSVRYDVMGRVKNQNTRIGMYTNETQLSYEYRTDGSLSSVSVRGGRGWEYTYDNDGRLTSIQNGNSVITIRYNKQGRVIARGSLPYNFDDDGFLHIRGNEVFEYDSLVHLVASYRKDGLYKLKYGYDGFGRLSSRFNEKTRQTLRFYYAEVGNPTRVTHVYNSTSGLITTFRYDMEGILFAIDQSNGRSWSVMCDNNGSPLAVITGSGSVLKEMSYTPFGELTKDTNPLFHLIIGYRGGISDPDTGLVHFANRASIQQLRKFGNRKNSDLSGFFDGVDYDPLIAQTTTPDYTMLVNQREKVPQPFKPYQVIDPVNPVPPYDQMTHVSNWLDALGFKLQNVAPDPKIDDRQKDKSSVECQLSHHLQTYINLQTVSVSSLVPQSRSRYVHTPNGALFAQGLVLSIDRGTISTHVTSSATNDVKRLSNVINGGEVIIGKNADSPTAAMSLTSDEKPVLHISKPFSSLRADKVTLKLTDTKRILDGGNSNTGTGSGSSSQLNNMIKVTIVDDVMTAESPNCVVVISYVTKDNSNGKTKESEEKRILDLALHQTATNAWAIEKEKLENDLTSRWNSRQKHELRTRGKVNGYKVEFFWDIDKYPEFANSGRNVKLTKT